jgi:hypothetical protein
MKQSKHTFRVQDLDREAKPVVGADIADNDIKVFRPHGSHAIIYRSSLCRFFGFFVILIPDLSMASVNLTETSTDSLTLRLASLASL